MMTDPGKQHELEVAEAIVDVLEDATVVRVCSEDRDAVRFAIRAAGAPLQLVALGREALRTLAKDPQRDIKIDYLRRDLVHAMKHRTEFIYPRPHPGAALAAASLRRTALHLDDAMDQLFTAAGLLGCSSDRPSASRHR